MQGLNKSKCPSPIYCILIFYTEQPPELDQPDEYNRRVENVYVYGTWFQPNNQDANCCNKANTWTLTGLLDQPSELS